MILNATNFINNCLQTSYFSTEKGAGNRFIDRFSLFSCIYSGNKNIFVPIFFTDVLFFSLNNRRIHTLYYIRKYFLSYLTIFSISKIKNYPAMNTKMLHQYILCRQTERKYVTNWFYVSGRSENMLPIGFISADGAKTYCQLVLCRRTERKHVAKWFHVSRRSENVLTIGFISADGAKTCCQMVLRQRTERKDAANWFHVGGRSENVLPIGFMSADGAKRCCQVVLYRRTERKCFINGNYTIMANDRHSKLEI
jgi:hypothetical protein